MRILLDESVPKGLKKLLVGHENVTVAEQGWSSFSNGKLLESASQEFDILLTADQNLSQQQNLARFDIAVIVLVAKTNQLVDYLPLKDKLDAAIESSASEKLQWVTA